jgi:hypothetical protein
MADANLTFYSSIRQGAALAITRTDVVDPPAPVVPRVQLPVTLGYDATAGESQPTAGTTLSLLGPGDIVGLDPRTIVRTFPQANDNEGEAGFLCYVDFDQVDLPWRYTPAAFAGTIQQDPTQSTDELRPWLTLMVLVEGTDFDPTADLRPPQGDEKLPQIMVKAQNLLPDPTGLWAWAHVQGQGALSGQDLADEIAGPPGSLVARLMSSRHLNPTTAYTAFLIPTFQRGVLAGQGKPFDPNNDVDGLTAAGNNSTTFPLQLPVYYSWRFQTGTVSSFQQAISELSPVPQLPPTVGLRNMDVADSGLPNVSALGDDTPMGMGGALQTPEQADVLDPNLNTDWVNALGKFLDPTQQATPDVVPPLYGRWYAVQDRLDYGGTSNNPPWFSRLNQDPRYRVAAGLGTEVVQRDQHALMAVAQEQASVMVNTVNRRRKIMQVGREVFTSLWGRHLQGTNKIVESILLVTAWMHGKILSCSGGGPPTPTILPIVSGSPFGGRLIPWRRPFRFFPVDPMIHKINNGGYIPKADNPDGQATPPTIIGTAVPGGLPDPGVGTIISTMSSDQRLYWGCVVFWVARKLLSTQGGKYWWLLRRLLRLGLDLIELASTQGAANVAVLEKLRAGTLTSADIQAIPQQNNFASVTQDPVLGDPTTWTGAPVPPTAGGKDNQQAAAFRQAAEALFDFVNGASKLNPQIPQADIPGLVTCILNGLTPATTFVAYEQAIHVRNPNTKLAWQAPDQLEPILTPPSVTFPMWNRLASISADWILPNVGDVPRNSVSLVETNQEFIEAFMVGLNHAINRELLWNGYPTDQRGTVFQQFWDPSGFVDGGGGVPVTGDRSFLDITELRGWDPTSALGSHTGRNPKFEYLVLLVRGDVIKRYPNVIVYASKAVLADPQDPKSIQIDDTKQMYPAFQAILTGDIAYYGFELTKELARGSGNDPGWFFVLQEHPSEPKFNDPQQPTSANKDNNFAASDYTFENGGNAVQTAAVLAQKAWEPPIRAVILGSELLPA